MQDIPGNAHVLKRLEQALASRRMIGFVGAGAAAALYPTWNTLLDALFDEALESGLVSTDDRDYWQRTAVKDPQAAVDFVKGRLGDGAYHEFLSRLFRPRTGADGRLFTALHATLVRLPLRGIVTTNYESGILEARLGACKDAPSTSFCTWRDSSAVHQWLTGRVFDDDRLPVLFAHGIYNRPETIVLGAESYRTAYESRPYKALFGRLIMEEQLLFVGFGFSDNRLDNRVDELITASAGRSSGAPRHFAFIGLNEKDTYSPFMRDLYRDNYNAETVFYRISEEHGHAELMNKLRSLELHGDAKASPREPEAPPYPPLALGEPPAIRVLFMRMESGFGGGHLLKLDVELREIVNELRRARFSYMISLRSVTIFEPQNILFELLEVYPQIVHMSGLGTRNGILLEDHGGKPQPLGPDNLVNLFSTVPGIHCVILATGFSREYVARLSSVIPFVIGAGNLSDSAAIAFAQGFYQAIGAGSGVEHAYHAAIAAIELSGAHPSEIFLARKS